MPAILEVMGLSIDQYPEPLRSALVVAFEREYPGPSDHFRPSPLLAALLEQAQRWAVRRRREHSKDWTH